jgi:hypothetical protein
VAEHLVGVLKSQGQHDVINTSEGLAILLRPSGPVAHQWFVNHQNMGPFRYEIEKYCICNRYSRPGSSSARRGKRKDKNDHRRG